MVPISHRESVGGATDFRRPSVHALDPAVKVIKGGLVGHRAVSYMSPVFTQLDSQC